MGKICFHHGIQSVYDSVSKYTLVCMERSLSTNIDDGVDIFQCDADMTCVLLAVVLML